MKFLKGETKIFKIFNIVDIFIIVAVIAIGAVAYTVLGTAISNQGSGQNKHEVVLEIKNIEKALCDAIQSEDKVYDKVQNTHIGKVLGAEYYESVEHTTSLIDGETKKTVVPDMYDMLLKMELDTTEDVYVGKLMSIKTKHFTGAGYLVDVKEIED